MTPERLKQIKAQLVYAREDCRHDDNCSSAVKSLPELVKEVERLKGAREVEFNLNDYIKVKLTDKGQQVLKDRHDRLYETMAKHKDFVPPEVDSDGYSKWQTWHFMSIFGERMHMGMQPLVSPNIKICLGGQP